MPPTIAQPELDNEPTVLLVEDVPWYRQALRQALRRECDVACLEAEDALHAIRLLEQHPEISVVVSDERLPVGPQGTALLETVGRRWPSVRRLLLSAYTTGAMVSLGVERGYEVLDKQLCWFDITEAICRLAKPHA